MTDPMDPHTEDHDHVNAAGTQMPTLEALGAPWGNRLIVMPIKPAGELEFAGGGKLILAHETMEAEEWLTYCGQVAAVGPCAFKGKKWRDTGFTDDMIPARGQWVLYDQYQFRRLEFKGVKLIVVQDTSLLHILPPGCNPRDFKIKR